MSLPELVKKQFKTFVDNIKVQVKQGKLNLKPDVDDDIPVQLTNNDKDFMYKKQPSMSE